MTHPAMHHNRAVDCAIQVVELLAGHEDGLSLSEVVAHCERPKTSVYRILLTLVTLDVLRHDESTGRYHLGSKLTTIAAHQRDVTRRPERPGRPKHVWDFTAPVLDRNGNLVATLTMSIPVRGPLPEQAAHRFTKLTRETAAQVTERISGRPRTLAG